MTNDVPSTIADLAADSMRHIRFELPELHGRSGSKAVPIDKIICNVRFEFYLLD